MNNEDPRDPGNWGDGEPGPGTDRPATVEQDECTHPKHSDDVAVDRFAKVMKEKLAQAREKGRGGWQECSPEELSRMLNEHAEKGDPVDVANFCAFLWNLGSPITSTVPIVKKPLTPRELQILELMSTGKRAKEVARMLNISVATVKTHAVGAYRKLNAKNRSEAVYFARQMELI